MSKIFELMVIISDQCIRKATADHSNGANPIHVTKFTNYIEQHYQEPISLSSVAEHFQYSSAYFSRLFKQEMGVNFNAYLSYVRVSHAIGGKQFLS